MLVLSVISLWVAIREMAQSFFVAKIVTNFIQVAQNISDIPRFVAVAFLHAHASALAVVFVSTLVAFVLFERFVRGLRSMALPMSFS